MRVAGSTEYGKKKKKKLKTISITHGVIHVKETNSGIRYGRNDEAGTVRVKPSKYSVDRMTKYVSRFQMTEPDGGLAIQTKISTSIAAAAEGMLWFRCEAMAHIAPVIIQAV